MFTVTGGIMFTVTGGIVFTVTGGIVFTVTGGIMFTVTGGIGRGDAGVEQRDDAVRGVGVAVEAEGRVGVVGIRTHHRDCADALSHSLQWQDPCTSQGINGTYTCFSFFFCFVCTVTTIYYV